MLNIAICDDNIGDLSNMVSLIGDYQALQRDKNSIHTSSFQNAFDLIASMEGGQNYDLVLLDVLMPYLTGMDAAKEIRGFNQDAKIIFMTSSPEFAVDSYSVNAYYYALKPLWKEQLFVLLDKVIAESQIHLGNSLLIKSKTGLTRIYTSRLEFAEVVGRTIFYHLSDDAIIEATGTITQLENMLIDNPGFIRTHRSYIVNMEHIDTLRQREILMQTGYLVPLARANYNQVKSAYFSFAFKE
ncbi:MAG: LytTR family DNA-binding domain-containing protein [Anaerovoracaceae bacterium]|nr:LytTR family DNA-binding domain-containing protein [Anaerovoracaceae bacterium]